MPALPRPHLLLPLWRVWPALLSGLLLAGAFPPLGWAGLAWAALIPFYSGLAEGEDSVSLWRGARRGFGWGFLFGLALFGVGAWWISEVGLLPWAILTTLQALPLGLLGAILAALLPRLPPSLRPFCFAAVWVLMEAARSVGLYAFPWFFLSSTQVRALPVLQLAAVTGQWGVSLLVALANALLAEAMGARREPRAAFAFAGAAVASVLLPAVWGVYAMRQVESEEASRPQRVVAAVQGSVLHDKNWNIDQRTVEQIYLRLTEEAAALVQAESLRTGAPPAFIAWPEEVMDRYLARPDVSGAVQRITRRTGIPVIVGSFEIGADGRFENSALLVTPQSALAGRYDKNRLVPVGEFFPLRPILGRLYAADRIPKVDFRAGETQPLLFTGEGATQTKVGALICYEQVFPYLARQEVRGGAEVLLCLTNDETFGTSAGPRQHADQAIVRAVETRRPFVRAAATGISSVISPTGRILSFLPMEERGVLVQTVGLRTEKTPFVRFGDWFLTLAGAVAAGCAVFALTKPQRKSPSLS